jgi:hypothetical protein
MVVPCLPGSLGFHSNCLNEVLLAHTGREVSNVTKQMGVSSLLGSWCFHSNCLHEVCLGSTGRSVSTVNT